MTVFVGFGLDPRFRGGDERVVSFFVGLAFSSACEADPPDLSSPRPGPLESIERSENFSGKGKRGSRPWHSFDRSEETLCGRLFGSPRKQGSSRDGNGECIGVVDFVNVFVGIGIMNATGPARAKGKAALSSRSPKRFASP